LVPAADDLRDAGRRIARSIADAPPIAILALGWLVLVIYAYPGQMTQDSYDHLREVRDRIWTDAHPPALNLLWRIADSIVAGPFGMLVFQATLFAGGLYLVFRRVFAPRRAAWMTTALTLFPPVMAPMAVIWKDAPMTGFLLLGVALLHDERRRGRIAGLVALATAAALRYNAFAATFPLIVLVFEWEPGARWFRRYAIATVAWLATTAAAFSFNAVLTDRQVHFFYSSLGVFDIVGTLAFVDQDLSDAELEKTFAGTDVQVHTDIHGAIRRIYQPDDFLPIITSGGTYPILWHLPITGYDPVPEAQREAIRRAYAEVLTSHPGAYLKHRLTVMGEVLWLFHPWPSGAIRSRAFASPDQHRSFGLGTGWSTLQKKMTRWLTWVWKKTPLFLPWIYAVVALVLLPFALRHRDILALLLSGLALDLSLLPLAPSPDYRYSHWMVLTVCIATIVLTARRARGIRDRPGDRPSGRLLSTASAPR
jgi:hypothetical protein